MFIIISERNVVPLVICYVFFYSEFVDQVSHDYLQHYSGILCYSSSKPAIARDCAGSFVDFILIIGCARPLFLVQLATPSTLQSKVCYKSNIIEAQVEKSTTFNTDSKSTGYVAPITRGGMLSMSWCCGVAYIINLLRARSYGKRLLRKSNKKRSNIT